MQTLGDIGRLLLNGDEHIACLVVEALVGVVVADVLDGVTDDLLVVEVGLGGDLAEDHDHARLSGRLAGNLGERVLPEAGIEDGIRDLVAGSERQQSAHRWPFVCSRGLWGRGRVSSGDTSGRVERGRQNAEPNSKKKWPTYQILSGCPSPTDSEVKRKLPWTMVRRRSRSMGETVRYLLASVDGAVGNHCCGECWVERCQEDA